MRKNVLIISASCRSGGNSDAIADSFLKGAVDAGHQVCKVSLRGMQIQFCNGCLLCQSTGICAISDDLSPVLEDMRRSDVIVFSTPIYFQDISGQLKTLLDRSNALYFSDHNIKDIYLLLSYSDLDNSLADHALHTVKNWVNAFHGTRFAGSIKGCGLDKLGDFQNAPQILEAAYQMGKGT